MSDLRERILGADDLGSELVEVPEWGVSVVVWGLTGLQRAKLLKNAMKTNGTMDFTKAYPMLVVMSSHYPPGDEKAGQLLFEDADSDTLASKSGTAIERLATAALTVSGLSEEAQKKSKSLDKG